MSKRTQTLAPLWESASLSAIGGEPGLSNRGGTQMKETSDGQKQSAWNSSLDPSSNKHLEARTSGSSEIIEAWLKAGGPGEVETPKLTRSSKESTFFSVYMDAQSTHDTFPARPIQQTDHREEFSQIAVTSFLQSVSHRSSNNSSSPWTTRNLDSEGRDLMVETLAQRVSPRSIETRPIDGSYQAQSSSHKPGSSSKQKARGSIFDGQTRASSQTSGMSQSNPLPYPTNLTPNPSHLRPHCAAKDRIKLWLPSNVRSNLDAQGRPIPLSQQDLERIGGVSLNALQPSTQAAYGSGLLAFHVYCDNKNIPEDMRAPVDGLIIKGFIATLAGIYSATAISNYVAAVRAWHIVHGMAWNIGGPEMDAITKGAKSMAPRTSTREEREPMTVEYIVAVHPHFSDSNPRDVAVFACLTSAFWATARLGEFTVKNLSAFNPEEHVKRSDLGEKEDRNGCKTTTLHVLKTKSNPTQGEELYWAKQVGPADPHEAMRKHLELNNPADDFHLFGYMDKGRAIPLTKRTFQMRVSEAATKAGLKPLKGHSIRIGSTLEYLLRGLPFDVMKVKGRWNSDAFHQYLRDHAKVLAPYMQKEPEINDQFIRIAVPSARS